MKELDNGVEFHLSLNPPPYANEQRGQLEINYKSIQEIHQQQIEKDNKPKQIASKEVVANTPHDKKESEKSNT